LQKTYPHYGSGDTITMYYDSFAATLQFFLNGKPIEAIGRVNYKMESPVFPAVTVHSNGDKIQINKKRCALSRYKLVELYMRAEHSICKQWLDQKLKLRLMKLKYDRENDHETNYH
jgi:hypothetical protein